MKFGTASPQIKSPRTGSLLRALWALTAVSTKNNGGVDGHVTKIALARTLRIPRSLWTRLSHFSGRLTGVFTFVSLGTFKTPWDLSPFGVPPRMESIT